MKNIDMTTGNPTKKILLFSLPIFLGNVFQQIYSMSDTLVVGRFLGKEALAAVGSSSALVVFINAILIGLCMGSGILFAEFYGAKKYKQLSDAVSTTVIFIFSVTVFISAVCIIFLDPLVRMFQVPEDALVLSKSYLRIIFAGLPFMFLYNIASAVLRAAGDSKTPLIFLILASVINVAFDFILVIYTPLGVKGPAWSTFAAQFFSGIPLCIFALKKLDFLDIGFRFNKTMFIRVAKYSLLTSLQQSIMNFGILLVQGLVNSFGIVAMAAFTAGVRIDSFAYMPAQDFGNAFATYIAQNKGAGKTERIREGFHSAILCSTVFCGIISAAVCFFAPNLIALFVPDDKAVIEAGVQYLRIEGAFYVLIGYLFLHYGFYRGLGHFYTSTVLTLISLGIRVAFSYALVWLGFGLSSIWWSIPMGWALADIAGFIWYAKLRKDMVL
ncbi:MATE family efflux transporter [Lacrimispora sp.]|uniref:MATE family efflux transporter n=1 Tax=Lacrimispora sp. TaxID=2719234 RepID=UPI002FDB0484